MNELQRIDDHTSAFNGAFIYDLGTKAVKIGFIAISVHFLFYFIGCILSESPIFENDFILISFVGIYVFSKFIALISLPLGIIAGTIGYIIHETTMTAIAILQEEQREREAKLLQDSAAAFHTGNRAAYHWSENLSDELLKIKSR